MENLRDKDWDEFAISKKGQLAIMTRDFRVVARAFYEYMKAKDLP